MNVKLLNEPDEKLCEIATKTCTSDQIDLNPNSTAFKNAVKSGHESVLEHCVYTFAVEGISRACSHQLVRHRLASYSQQSQRYVRLNELNSVIPKSIKNTEMEKIFNEYILNTKKLYDVFIENNIPEEDARYILPNACSTNIIITMNARELIHFCNERLCNRAQWEIRELAEKMTELCKNKTPTIARYMQPKCERDGFCKERNCCGKMKKVI